MISQVIRLLPDSVANQIAAGEVVQRPASVVKELVENSIDAFAKSIKIYVKDAGKTLIQVVDDGIGMSEVDARMAFERHATSKISSADDLFAISTFGFRGEALASIASVAQVEMITRREEDEVGTRVDIHGSKFIKQESLVCAKGTTISVKNLFFNIPARRRFLKSDAIEFRHIVDEFIRVALSHPEVSFLLVHNQSEVYNLTATTLKQRIVHLFGKNISTDLLDVSVDTSIVSIQGFIGKPESAKKKNNYQFLFVNNRYFRHPFLYRVILNAYGNLLLPETTPSYFIYFSCDPKFIDVNIHPTKTEIKFEDERAVAQILEATVRQTLGNTNILPNIEFNNESAITLPFNDEKKMIKPPSIKINPDYNPFEPKQKTVQWKNFFEPEHIVEKREQVQIAESLSVESEKQANDIIQLHQRFLLVTVKSGLMVIDQHRAHFRVLYEMLINKYELGSIATERLIFPEILELDQKQFLFIKDLLPHLQRLGFAIQMTDEKKLIIEEIPSFWSDYQLATVFENFFNQYEELEKLPDASSLDFLLIPLAKSIAVKNGKPLNEEERQRLFDELFATSNPQYAPDGKLIFYIIPVNEFEKKF